MIRPLFILFTLLSVTPIFAQDLKFARIFTDNMVLQKGKELPVWGFAQNGTQITITLHNEMQETTAKNGKWRVRFKPMNYGSPYQLTVSSQSEKITLRNIAVGEVWIASGQSNMAFHLIKSNHGKETTKNSANPDIRLFSVAKNIKPTEKLNDLAECQGWHVSNPESAVRFSAVAYYFARDLQTKMKVTVGIIKSAVGGTKAELWISKKNCPPFMPRKNRAGILRGPSFHYNSMIHPLAPFACRGFLWYQGESNAAYKGKYEHTQNALVQDWRSAWNEELPFLFVQLPNFKARNKDLFDGGWAYFREAQFKTLKLPKTGMVCSIDIGDPDNIHPTNKLDVGKCLSLVADFIAYNKKATVYSGPTFRQQQIKGREITISFDHLGGGLVARNGDLKGFAIAGDDKKWRWAEAKILGDSIRLHHKEILKPLYVRYGFANNPVISLFNKEGLPAVPFRTDN